MELLQAKQLAEQLLSKYGLYGWKFSTNRQKHGLGLCKHNQKMIQLSKYYIQLNTEEHIKNTILHEICHALVGSWHGHDRIWKLKCIEMGVKPERCSDDAVMPEGRYKGVCPCCGYIYYMHRLKSRRGVPQTFQNLVSRGNWCTKCGKDKGRIVWTDSYTNLTLYYVKKPNPYEILSDLIQKDATNFRTHNTQVLDLVQVSSTEAREMAKT